MPFRAICGQCWLGQPLQRGSRLSQLHLGSPQLAGQYEALPNCSVTLCLQALGMCSLHCACFAAAGLPVCGGRLLKLKDASVKQGCQPGCLISLVQSGLQLQVQVSHFI
jgi:hypothetical protein